MEDFDYVEYPSSLITKEAPNFEAEFVMPDNTFQKHSFYDYIDGKYALLFFYPLDFTFVCPSEILAFHNRVADFKSRDTVIIGVSVDSHFSHFAWRNTPVEKGGIGQIAFPLVADITKDIARKYGVLINEAVALRGSFLVDKNKKVRHCVINDLPLGRNVDEAIRMVDALQHHEKHGEVCPAGWNKGQEAMKPNQAGVATYLADNATKL